MSVMKKVIITTLVLTLMLMIPETAQGNEEGGIKTSSNLELQISSLPEAKLKFTQGFIFPFLRGASALTSGNNIRADIGAEATPVSVGGMGKITWTPIAFLELSGGGRLGSGWNMALGNGIGLNVPIEGSGTPRKAEVDGSAFDGIQWKTWGGGAFQFDLAAIFPGDWNHVVLRVYNELNYAAYTRAAKASPWYFENEGEYNNGWTLHGEAVLGYQMPLSPVLDFVAIMAEMDKVLYNTTGGDYWGEDLEKWTLSALFNFSISPRFNTTMVVQMRTRRNHGISDFANKGYYYRDFELMDEGGKQRLLFYRVAALMTYKIK